MSIRECRPLRITAKGYLRTASIIDRKCFVMAKSNKKPPADKPVNDEKEKAEQAHRDAEKDIENDPEMDMDEEPGDDLDEGELANLDNSND